MLRIMQVAYSFAIGGSEMVIRDISLGLIKAGWTVGVSSLEYDGPLRKELADRGVVTTVIDKRGREIFGSMYRLWQSFRAFRPDIVHTHHLYELIYAWPGALFCGAKLIHTEHEFHTISDRRSRLILRILAHFCQKITAVDNETATYLIEKVKLPPRKVVVVTNGIDTERFSADRRDSTRDELGLPNNATVIGIVARLEPPKNLPLLLRTFGKVVRGFPDSRLLIVGDGSLRNNLKILSEDLGIERQVLFLGARRDIPGLLASMDLFVMTSDFEGLPMALLEAMASGLPIVTTSAGGISSVIEDGFSGFLVDPGDEEALADKIRRVLTDHPHAKQMGSNARTYVERNYAFNKILNRYMQLYSEAAR